MAVDTQQIWGRPTMFDGAVPSGVTLTEPVEITGGSYSLNAWTLGNLFDLTAGAGDTLDVVLQHSVDKINWIALVTVAQQSADAQIFSVIPGAPMNFLRLSITQAGSGTWVLTARLSGSGVRLIASP